MKQFECHLKKKMTKDWEQRVRNLWGSRSHIPLPSVPLEDGGCGHFAAESWASSVIVTTSVTFPVSGEPGEASSDASSKSTPSELPWGEGFG